jgi:hypothetical protein
MSLYRGSIKHKNRPAEGRKGTLCPEWTHEAMDTQLGHDVFGHPWEKTIAHALFTRAIPVDDMRRRFATSNGIAFEAKPTADGSWHGYPVPWESVPADILRAWVDSGAVTRRQIKRHLHESTGNVHWALDGDQA